MSGDDGDDDDDDDGGGGVPDPGHGISLCW